MEKTLAIIKPNITAKNRIGRIITIIEEEGFNITRLLMKKLSKEETELFYSEHKGKAFFENLVKFMTSEKVVLLVLEAENAVERWRKIMGVTDPQKAAPQTIRQLYGESIEANAVHGSDSQESAKREIKIFFPEIE